MATAVRIAHIERRAQSLKADFHGFLLPMTRLSVSAHVAGEIVQQWVEISDQVEAGQALFKIDDALRAIEYRQAQASLARAQSQHELAVANWKRIESMSDQASSSMERIGAQTQLKAALADQQRAEATVRQAALLLERTTVHSPIDGVVSDIYL
ncbi:MAG: biotin/lipoyl-binding protein, partial [Planctomycetes bacterium]|nr:biotin/lipoyl-binding protein [Planctomycetota bacterium]